MCIISYIKDAYCITTCPFAGRDSYQYNTVKALKAMVLIFDGSSEIDAQLCSENGNLISVYHLFRYKAVANLKLITGKFCFPSHVRKMFCVTIKYKYHALNRISINKAI